MKHSIYRSLRGELVIYSIISLLLAVVTESAMGLVLVMVARTFGVSRGGYGKGMLMKKEHSPVQPGFLPDYRGIKHWNKDTLMVIMFIILLLGFLLFIFYFLMLTRRITKDMSYISNCISDIASGSMETKIIGINREDEIGEIVLQVNRMHDEIERLMKSEREALQANKDMITCVAHDLRTPLTSIIGYLQLATDVKKYTVEERQKYANIAMRKADRMQGLIEELFNYTKLMSGEITVHRSDIDIVKLVVQMTEEFYPLFMENNLEYTLKQNVKSLIMNVDGELIARAVSNLIGNAVKYGRDGKAVHIELENYNSELQIRVVNFGLVIPEESIEHIFDKFYRVESSRSVQTGGTGLGLNIAQEIAVLHGGKITVQSSVKGTCFTIALPIDNPGEEKGTKEKEDGKKEI